MVLGWTIPLFMVVLVSSILVAQRFGFHSIPPAPSVDLLPELPSETRILWGISGDVTIESLSEQAAYGSLGYVHARNHPWTMALLRQAALGRLSEWFGEKAIPADMLTRRLGIASIAHDSLESIPESGRSILSAYASGATAAWNDPDFRLLPEFVLLDYTPESWEAWHTLAVERLIAYLAVDIDCFSATEYCQADSTLHALLLLDGFESSLAWVTSQDSSTSTLFQRHVYGSSAQSIFQEAQLNIRGHSSPRGLTLIGTPYFVGGHSQQASWAMLLSSSARLFSTGSRSSDSVAYKSSITYEMFKDASANEYEVDIERLENTVIVAKGDTNTFWGLEWSGFSGISDIGSWLDLPEDGDTTFVLFSGDQIRMNSVGRWRVLGSPKFESRLGASILISNDHWVQTLPFPELHNSDPLVWASNLKSEYASAALPALLPLIGDDIEGYSPSVTSALAYLRNWDYEFSSTSIGASIFCAWMTTFHNEHDSLLTAQHIDPDSLTLSLLESVEMLTTKYGFDPVDWRWSLFNPERLSYSASFIPGMEELTFFGSLEWPGAGHPTTPYWGSNLSAEESAFVEMWNTSDGNSHWSTRRRTSLTPDFWGRTRMMVGEVSVHVLPSFVKSSTMLAHSIP